MNISPTSSPSNWLERLESLDPSLFDPVETSATTDDRRSLLALQVAVRHPGYVYLEIGSEKGGSLQSHLADPWCAKIYSIDLRVYTVPDVRGKGFAYYGNTTAAMMARLSDCYPQATSKILTFDCQASDVALEKISPKPHLIYIDGEHTLPAVQADFAIARQWIDPAGLIAFHDSQLVHKAIEACLATLEREGVEHHSAGLPGALYVIAIGKDAVDRILQIKIEQTSPQIFFRRAPAYLRHAQWEWLKKRCRHLLRRCRQRLFS